MVPGLTALGLILLPLLVSLKTVIILGGSRYLTVAVPALCLGAGVGLDAWWRRRGLWRAVGVLALVLVLTAEGLYFRTYYTGREKRMWREAVAFLDENWRPGDALFTIPPYCQWVVEYYSHDSPRFVPPEEASTLNPPPRRIWVLTVSPGRLPPERALIEAGWTPQVDVGVAGKWLSSLVRVTGYGRASGN
jgi:hypothetical protein